MFRNANIATTGAGAFVVALSLSACLVSLAIRVCRAHGWVAQPRPNRWHKGTPSLFGGVPIWLSCVVVSAVFLPFSDRTAWTLIGASTVVFLLGLADDILRLRPSTKLAGQFLAAALVVSLGIVYPLHHSAIINVLVSLLWIVGITNAFNLLDNMDGLAAGVAIIAAIYLSIFYASVGSQAYAILAVLVAGAAAGFLIFNLNPARIFMGDSGSMFLGFLLASTSLLEVTHVSGVPALVLAPVAVLAIPVFDTFFVSVTRCLRGQKISEGGTDHSSHRLVQLGLNERNAVWLLYGLCAASGAVGLIARHVFYSRAIGLVGFWFLFLVLFGVHLFRSHPTASQNHHQPTNTFAARLLVRDTLALLLDPVAVSLSYYVAYFLRFSAYVPRADLDLFVRTWPIVLSVKYISLWACRVYRYSWWRGSITDSYRLAKATLVGEGAAVLLLIALYRFVGFSRVVFLLDAALSWALLLLIRKSFSHFRDLLGGWGGSKTKERRVLVLGTSEQTELALRYLRDRGIACAGLIDTNGGADLGRCVWGTEVVGSLDDLSRLGPNFGVSEIVLPENERLPYSEEDFHSFCQNAHLHLLKVGLYAVDFGAVHTAKLDSQHSVKAS